MFSGRRSYHHITGLSHIFFTFVASFPASKHASWKRNFKDIGGNGFSVVKYVCVHVNHDAVDKFACSTMHEDTKEGTLLYLCMPNLNRSSWLRWSHCHQILGFRCQSNNNDLIGKRGRNQLSPFSHDGRVVLNCEDTCVVEGLDHVKERSREGKCQCCCLSA